MGHYRPMSTTNGSSTLAAAVVKQIRAEREAADIQVSTLVERTGISPRAMTRYLNGERELSLAQIESFADAFGISVETLIKRARERQGQ